MAKKKILVVEDDRDISELIVYNLEREGYDIACLYDGSQAVDFVRKRRPELIILDLMLPEVDGIEICRTLKSDPATTHIPLVMLTAKSEEADVVAGLNGEFGASAKATSLNKNAHTVAMAIALNIILLPCLSLYCINIYRIRFYHGNVYCQSTITIFFIT